MFNLTSWCNTVANWADLVAAKAPNALTEAATILREAASFFEMVGFQCDQPTLVKCKETQDKLDNMHQTMGAADMAGLDFSKIMQLVTIIQQLLKLFTPAQPN